uniref:Protein kinase domain-containing protein n=1 Tax=Aegilops tauschii subsp. strangulata TaxID=200361 RepID=A0A453R8G8_AEGTS
MLSGVFLIAALLLLFCPTPTAGDGGFSMSSLGFNSSQLMVFTRNMQRSAHELFLDKSLSALNNSMGLIVLPVMFSFSLESTSVYANFTMQGSSPASFTVVFAMLPADVLRNVGTRYIINGVDQTNNNEKTIGSNEFAAVEIGTLRSSLSFPGQPGVGLNVTVTPIKIQSLAVRVDYFYSKSRAAVYVGPVGSEQGPDLVASGPVNIKKMEEVDFAFIGFFSDRVSNILSNIKPWGLSVQSVRPKHKGPSWLVILLSVVGSAAATAITAAAFAVYYRSKYRRWNKDLQRLARSMQHLPGMPRHVDFADIKKATKNFHSSMQLGAGGFGAVYRCKLPAAPEVGGPEVEAAVKKFTRNHNGCYDDFMEEVSVVNRLRHRNIAPLVGWSYHSGVPLLIFELIPNGSLDQHLFHPTRARFLQWETRYDIVKDIATGLHYVHHEYEPAVLHRDIKASNVLLDSAFRARLGDFGIARAVGLDRNSVTGFAGTRGYIAPDYACSYKATRETDVYAFGVVVLEIVTGKPALHRDVPSDNIMSDWVWQLHREGELINAVDGVLAAAGFDADDARRLLLLGLACTNPNPADRPSMATVVRVVTKLAPSPDVPLERPTFVWPPQGLCTSTPGSTCGTGTSIFRTVGSSAMVELEQLSEELPIVVFQASAGTTSGQARTSIEDSTSSAISWHHQVFLSCQNNFIFFRIENRQRKKRRDFRFPASAPTRNV